MTTKFKLGDQVRHAVHKALPTMTVERVYLGRGQDPVISYSCSWMREDDLRRETFVEMNLKAVRGSKSGSVRAS